MHMCNMYMHMYMHLHMYMYMCMYDLVHVQYMCIGVLAQRDAVST
jgi:hypothetical protein